MLANGKQRPLGIPTVKTRAVQMAVVLVLGPNFEADLPPEQYAYHRRLIAHAVCKWIGNSHAVAAKHYLRNSLAV